MNNTSDLILDGGLLTLAYPNRDGGFLSIDKTDVSLLVPRRKDNNDKLNEVFIALNPDSSGEDNTTVVSPVVKVGSPKLKFEEPMLLAVPHCIKNPADWKFRVAMSQHERGQQGKWIVLNEDDFRLIVQTKDVQLFIQTPGSYRIEAQPTSPQAERSVALSTFQNENEETNRNLTSFRLHVYYDTSASEKEVRFIEELNFNGKLCNSAAVTVTNEGGNLSCDIGNTSSNWKASDTSQHQTFEFSEVWRATHTLGYYRTYQMAIKEGVKSGDKMWATINISQHRNVKFTHQQLFNFKEKEARDNQEVTKTKFPFRMEQPECRPNISAAKVIPHDSFSRLCTNLDIEREQIDGSFSDYKGFAQLLELENDECKWLQEKGDPTKRLLNYAINKHLRDGKKTLEIRETLKRMFEEIRNTEAQRVMENILILHRAHVPTVAREIYEKWKAVASALSFGKDTISGIIMVNEKKTPKETCTFMLEKWIDKTEGAVRQMPYLKELLHAVIHVFGTTFGHRFENILCSLETDLN
ncbi:uncharacterized protein LOC144356538 [Saccoglossus kowalevskii]